MKHQTAAIVIFSMLLFKSPSLAQQNAQPATNPVPVHSIVVLAPANSRISFVGTHVGDDPKPRLGGFKQFQGYAVIDPNKNVLDSIVFDVNVDSVWTQFQKLTGHLKNADFFDTSKFPTARFVSTEIKKTEAGQCQVTGNLTLHGKTKSLSFPAQYRLDNGGLVLATKFKFDRSEFGMNQMLSGVDKLVEIEIYVGQTTTPAKEQPGHGGKDKKKNPSLSPLKELQPEVQRELQHVSIRLPSMT